MPHMSETLILPDILKPKLTLVFCGTAAGPVSAAQGQYYAHPQNKFWRTLHHTGLTSHHITPENYCDVLHFKIGLTDIAKTVSGLDKDLPKQSLGPIACEALRKRIITYQPAFLAFTSMEGGKRYLRRKVSLGQQPETIGVTKIWVLPSPSPLALWNWQIDVWQALADQVKAYNTSHPE